MGTLGSSPRTEKRKLVSSSNVYQWVYSAFGSGHRTNLSRTKVCHTAKMDFVPTNGTLRRGKISTNDQRKGHL